MKTDDEPSEEESIEDDAMKRILKEAKKSEELKNKTAETALTLQMK
jgi:hypothetical protein